MSTQEHDADPAKNVALAPVVAEASERRAYLGGSDIAAAMGVSRWRSPLSLWAEKTGKLPQDAMRNSEAMEIGLELEEYVARKFERRTGKKLRRESRELRHPHHPFLRGHIDRLVLNEDAIFEAKTTSAWQRKAWERDAIPTDYVLQLNWYLGLMGREVGYLGVLIGGQQFLWKQLVCDRSLYAQQVAAAVKFWTEFVEKDVMPMATADDHDLLAQLFPTTSTLILPLANQAASEVDRLLTRRASSLRQIKTEQLIVDDCEAKLKAAIGEAGGLTTDWYRATWFTEHRRRLDSDRLKQDGLYDQYATTTSTRVLRVREVPEKEQPNGRS